MAFEENPEYGAPPLDRRLVVELAREDLGLERAPRDRSRLDEKHGAPIPITAGDRLGRRDRWRPREPEQPRRAPNARGVLAQKIGHVLFDELRPSRTAVPAEPAEQELEESFRPRAQAAESPR